MVLLAQINQDPFNTYKKQRLQFAINAISFLWLDFNRSLRHASQSSNLPWQHK